MIVHMQQDQARRANSYSFWQDGALVCKMAAPVVPSILGEHYQFQYQDGTVREMLLEPRGKGSLKDRLSYYFLEGGEQVGSICGAAVKKGWAFFRGYMYNDITYHGRKFALYEVGLGSEGLFFCLYEGNRLVAVADKKLIVHNWLDHYMLYLEEDDLFPLFSMVMVYCDVTRFGNADELEQSEIGYAYRTPQKELRAKYDPAFIPRIKARDGRGG